MQTYNIFYLLCTACLQWHRGTVVLCLETTIHQISAITRKQQWENSPYIVQYMFILLECKL